LRTVNSEKGSVIEYKKGNEPVITLRIFKKENKEIYRCGGP
jgi:hypothetical protein